MLLSTAEIIVLDDPCRLDEIAQPLLVIPDIASTLVWWVQDDLEGVVALDVF